MDNKSFQIPPKQSAKCLSEEEREQSRKNALFQKNLEEGLWIFGYGSLMWNPEFDYLEKIPGILSGYRRDFCVWAMFSRGTPEKPGLSLGLRAGGQTHGYLFKVSSEAVEEVTRNLWKREVISGILKPVWVNVESDGKTIEALTFVVNTGHIQYAELEPKTAAPYILEAKGIKGTCFDYLDSTIQQLESIGISDPYLEALMEEVRILKSDK